MSTLIIGAAAVLRTLMVVAVGSFSATLLDNVGTTNSWFSVINVYVFLPCLLFGHFSTGFSVQVFQEGIPLVIFGFCRMLIGAATTKIAGFFGLLDEETQPLTLLATSSSNAVAIPLSMLEEMATRVSFLSDQPEYQVRDAQSGKLISPEEYCVTLMFVFAIPINFAIWSFGQYFIRSAAEHKHEMEKKLKHQQQQEQQQEMEDKKIQQQQQLQSARISVGQDLSSSQDHRAGAQDENNNTTTTSSFENKSPVENAGDDNKDDQKLTQIVVSPSSNQEEDSSPVTATIKPKITSTSSQQQQHHEKESTLVYFFRVYIIRALSVPLVASLGGIAVSLIPGVQIGITGGWPIPTALSNSIVLLGNAAVPAALLTVGITVFRTLTAKKKVVAPSSQNENEENKKKVDEKEQQETSLSTSSFTKLGDKITNLLGIQASLVVTTSLVQLVITPLVAFIIIRYFIYSSDFEKIQNANTNGIFDEILNTDNADIPIPKTKWMENYNGRRNLNTHRLKN